MAKADTSIRGIVKAELERQKLTTYALWRRVKDEGGNLNKQTVYNFIDGKSEITTDKLQMLLSALNLRVTR